MNDNKVILYTTHCPMCKALKMKLDKNNIEYEVCDDIDLMIKKGFNRAPVLEVDGKALTVKEAMQWVGEHRCK